MADLQLQLDDLKTAYRTGATSISYEGKTISYRSGAEMQAAIASLEAEIAGTVPVRSIVIRSDKGW
jgi:hypothetical protein